MRGARLRDNLCRAETGLDGDHRTGRRRLLSDLRREADQRAAAESVGMPNTMSAVHTYSIE